jgi:putative membrane protein
MRFVLWVLVNAVALAAATWLLGGITLSGATAGDRAGTLVAVALVFGVVNAVVRPVVKVLSFPLILLTLGLLVFVINALMLLLTGWVCEQLGLAFRVSGFWAALGGALVITAVSWLLELVLRDRR